MENEEIWKDIPNYEGLYQVSNLGRIKSLERYNKRKHYLKKIKERILKTTIDKRKKCYVKFYKGSSNKTFFVHRLVLETFVGPCPDGYESCHKNDIQTDNRLDNLYWGTKEQNIQDKIRNGKTTKGISINVGEKCKNSKLTNQQVMDIKNLLKEKFLQITIAKLFDVSPRTISDIKKNRTWKHIKE